HRILVEVRRDDLPANRQPAHATYRNRHCRNAGEIRRYGEDVVEIHLVGVTDSADGKCGGRRGGREYRVHPAGKYGAKIFGDERAHGLRLLVVRVVIASGKDIRAEENATRNLRPKALR